jgi:hypothetical protein
MKIRPVGAELFHADRQTDMTQLTVQQTDSQYKIYTEATEISFMDRLFCAPVKLQSFSCQSSCRPNVPFTQMLAVTDFTSNRYFDTAGTAEGTMKWNI